MVNVEHAREVGRRQAFGSKFDPLVGDAASVSRIRLGWVEFDPHPPVQVDLAKPIDWQQDPFGQRNWRAQLHMLRWVDPIRRLAASGDRTSMGLWAHVTQDWVAHNPPAESHGGDYAWRDMVDAMRTYTLLFGLPYVDDPDWLVDSLLAHGEWIADANHIGHSNHALHQHSALMVLGSALSRKDWVDLALSRISEEIASAFDDDGVNTEAAPGYWLLNYRWIKELARRLTVEGLDCSSLDTAVERLPVAIAQATTPDGNLEVIGDTAPRQSVKGEDLPELRWISSRGSEGSPPHDRSVVYRSGYAFGRSGWGDTDRALGDETFYSVRFGRADAVHGHQDGASLTYWTGGRPVLVEAGKYGYRTDEFRLYALGRLGHNVCHVHGRPYDLGSDVALVESVIDPMFDYVHLRDVGYSGVRLDRWVVFMRVTESLLVVDMVVADAEVTAETRWHLDPRASATASRNTVDIENTGRRSCLVWGGSAPSLTLVSGGRDPVDGWATDGYASMQPTTVVRAVRSGRRFRMFAVVGGGSAGKPVQVRASETQGGTQFVVYGAKGTQQSVVLDREGRLAGPQGGTRNVVGSETGTTASPATCTEAFAEWDTAGADEVERFERDNIEVLTALSLGRQDLAKRPGVETELLKDRLRGGQDYGAAALLREVEARREPGADAVSLIPSATRVALVPDSWRRYSSPHDTLDLTDQDSLHAIASGPLVLPLRVVQKEGAAALVVVFHGAVNRERTAVPRFERMRSLENSGLDIHVAAVADPTLDLDCRLQLAWYLGTRNHDLAVSVAAVVEQLAASLSCSSVLLFGSSGGGFAALSVGALIGRPAAVLAVNAQTDVARYHRRHSLPTILTVFGTDELRPQDRTRVSLIDRYRAATGRPRVHYVVNSGDGHHRRFHAAPFFDFLSAERSEMKARMTTLDLGPGHRGPSTAGVVDLVRAELDERSEVHAL